MMIAQPAALLVELVAAQWAAAPPVFPDGLALA